MQKNDSAICFHWLGDIGTLKDAALRHGNPNLEGLVKLTSIFRQINFLVALKVLLMFVY